MHFYDWNIGDYAKKTAHLTNEEDIAYRRALDMYYDTEKPLETQNIPALSRRLRVGIEALQNVINEFFPDGRNKHADEKIAEYHTFLDRQKNNGRLGGRPKTTQAKPTANPKEPKPNPVPSQPLTTELLPTNQEPIKKTAKVKKEETTLTEFIASCKAAGKKKIVPEDDPVYDYAKSINLPEDYLILGWHAFKQGDQTKKQKDWLATFRQYVKKGWLKVWWIKPDGTYELTTYGKQLDMELQSKETAAA